MSNTFTAMLDTSAVGDYSASYTLHFSDEDLPGASPLADLILTLTGTIENAPVETADFDQDTDVDGTDFWPGKQGFGATDAELWQGDANGDRVVDAADLAVWGEQFGTQSPHVRPRSRNPPAWLWPGAVLAGSRAAVSLE